MRDMLLALLAMIVTAAPALATAKEPGAMRIQAPEAPAPEEDEGRGAWLGIYLQEITPDLSSALNLKSERGALVRQVEEGSPASAAGLEKGDVIVGVDGHAVAGPSEVTERVRAHSPGERVRIKIVRLGRERTLTARLAERPADFGESLHDEPGMPEMAEPPDAPKAPEAMPEAEAPEGAPGLEREMTRGGRPYLGVRLEAIDDDLAKYFGAKGGEGVLITSVEEPSPAASAGLHSGDVILRIDGDRVRDPGDVVSAVREKDPREELTLVVLRERREKTISIEVGRTRSPRVSVRGRRAAPMPERYRERESHLRRPAPRDRQDLREEMDRLRQEMERLREEVQRLRDEDN